MTTDLIDQVARLARLARAGASLHSAVHEVAHRNPDSLFHRLVVALGRELTLAAAVETLHPATEDERLVVLVLSLATKVGGDVPAQLDSLLATLGEREQARRERRTHAATALASTRLLTVLPFVATALIVADDHRMLRTLFASPAGLVCISVGAALNGVGRLWTRRIITRP